MNIEVKSIEFHPNCQFEKLPLTPLQVQYLIFLRMNKSIYELVQYNLTLGWLVSFKELYALIESLALHHWIINPEIKDYFQNIKLSKANTINNFNAANDSKASFSTDKLLKLPFFRSLESKLADFLLKSARLYNLKANTFICNAGDSTRSLFVLLSGQAGIYKNVGHVKNLIALLSPPAVFGEAGFLLGEKRTADTITLKDSDVLVIPHNTEILDPYLNKERATQIQHRFWVQHALLHSELFKNIPADCLDALTFAGKFVELKNNKILFNQGDKSLSAYILIQGEVIVEKDGKKIGSLTQGAFIGEISLMVSNGLRTAKIYSTKDTLLLEIHRDEFYKLLSSNLFLAKEIEHLAHERLKSDATRPK